MATETKKYVRIGSINFELDDLKGWSPILAVVSDDNRRVLQITNWTGGVGSKPATGQYLGVNGLVDNIADGTDIRGAQGADGGGLQYQFNGVDIGTPTSFDVLDFVGNVNVTENGTVLTVEILGSPDAVLSVNNVLPDVDGNVQLSPSDIGAEDVNNKKTDLALPNNTAYPTTQAVVDGDSQTLQDANSYADLLFADAELLANKRSNLESPNNTTYPTTQATVDGDTQTLADANAYAESLVVGLWDDRGIFDASGGSYPTTGGSGTGGAILKGDIWTISGAGTLPISQVVEVGDTVRALVDAPAQTQTNWAIAQNNIGFVPENQANKKTTMTGNENSNIFYLTAKAVYDWAVGLFAPLISPALTGTPTSPTATLHNNSTQIANTAFIRNELGELKTDIVVLADSVDVTKKVTFNTSAVGTGQTRTLTFPNINVNLGKITNSVSYSNGVLTLTDLSAGTLTANINAMSTSTLADADTQLVKNTSYIIPTLTGSRKYTLPATPSEGDVIQLRSGKFSQFTLNLLRNGSTINGAAADFQLALDGTFTVAYIGGTWRVSYVIGDSFDNSRNTYTSRRNLNILGYGNSFAGTYSAVLASRLSSLGSATDSSAIVAGTGHSLNSPTSAILSGNGNTVLRNGGVTAAVNSWVGGGSSNTVSLVSGKTGTWIGGGTGNAAYGTYSWIGGGSGNTVNNDFGVVLTGTTSTVSGNGSVVLTSGAGSGATQSSAYAVSFNGTNDLAFGDGHTVLGAGTAPYKAGEFVANLTNGVTNGLTAATPSTVNSTQFPVVQASLNASSLQVAYVNAIIFVTSGVNDEYVLAARRVRLHRNSGGTLTILGTDVISTDVGANFSAVTITPTISGNNLYFAIQITCATTRSVRILTNIRALLAPT